MFAPEFIRQMRDAERRVLDRQPPANPQADWQPVQGGPTSAPAAGFEIRQARIQGFGAGNYTLICRLIDAQTGLPGGDPITVRVFVGHETADVAGVDLLICVPRLMNGTNVRVYFGTMRTGTSTGGTSVTGWFALATLIQTAGAL